MSGDRPRSRRRLGKAQRQHLLAKLIEAQPVHNQGQLVELLAAEGVSATQATVSRDLDDLGAIKVRLPGGETAYAIPALPKEQLAPEDHLRRVCGDWVVEVAHSGNLVVRADPTGLGPRGGLGARPLRPARRARHRGRRRHDPGDHHRGRRRRGRRRPPRRPGRALTGPAPTPESPPEKEERRWRSEWCWPTAAVSTPPWPCAG